MISLNDVKDWNLEKCNDELSAMTNSQASLESLEEARVSLITQSIQLDLLSTDNISSNDAIRLLDNCQFPKVQDWQHGKTLYFIENDHAIVISSGDVYVVYC